MMWGDGYGYGMFGGIGMILFWVVIIAIVVLIVRQVGGGMGRQDRRDAMDVLRERFAAGEIDEEEFERRKKALQR